MNALKLILSAAMLMPCSLAGADPRSNFSDCIESKTKAAQVLRLSVAEFSQTMKAACRPEEIALISELSMTSMTELKEVKELNARYQVRSQAYASEARATNDTFYAKWLASTAR